MVKKPAQQLSVTTRSPAETMALGQQLGALLAPGHVIALSGPLGAGKTTFVKGAAAGLGLPDAREVKSPTFVLIKEYAGRHPIAHVDLYRLDDAGDAERLHLQDYFTTHMCLIEWAEKFPQLLPAEHLLVRFAHEAPTPPPVGGRLKGGRAIRDGLPLAGPTGGGATARRLTFEPRGASAMMLLAALRQCLRVDSRAARSAA